MPSPIVDLARELASRGVPRFYPSAIADRLDVDPKEVVTELNPLVDQGLLAVRLDLVCDECGATVKTYSPGSTPGEGETVECIATDDPHSVELTADNIWLSYKITDAFRNQAQAGAKEGSEPPGRHRLMPRTTPWFGATPMAVLPIHSARSTSASTSTSAGM